MDIELLRTFLDLNRTRHFGKTAKNMHLTQAAISNRIKQLETELGVALFDRSSRALDRTPEGTRLVNHARRQVASWNIAKQDVSVKHAHSQLVIAGSLHLWDVMVQNLLYKMRAKYENMAIIAESHTPDLLTRKLIEGTLDIAIMLEPSQLETMQIKEVATLEFVCVSDNQFTKLSDKYLAKKFIYVDWGISHDLDFRRAFPDAPEPLTRVSEVRMAINLMLSFGGCAYVPMRMVEHLLAEKKLFIVKDAPHFKRRAYATYPVRSVKKELIEKVLEIIDE